MAAYLQQTWEDQRYDGLDGQFDIATTVTGVNFGAITSIAAMLGSSAVFGTLPGKAKLDGWPDPVKVAPVFTTLPATAPASLADGLRRFPEAEDAQVKVEKYTFEDGTAHYVAYIKGTQSGLYGASEPWDMKSNAELYTGQVSASYQATLDALHQAGAEAGDVVDVYAHSQGAMVGSYLAMGDEFDVQMLVTAGSPVQPTLRDDQLLIQLRHTDDVVNALAGGGSQGGTGSPERPARSAVRRYSSKSCGDTGFASRSGSLITSKLSGEPVPPSAPPAARLETMSPRCRISTRV
jgi:hypothetical protein